jgi:hypothetical protein
VDEDILDTIGVAVDKVSKDRERLMPPEMVSRRRSTGFFVPPLQGREVVHFYQIICVKHIVIRS